MGSSTASETTINTSTDSANTMLTMVTTTDGEQPDDSFDLMDIPSEMSPPGASSSTAPHSELISPVLAVTTEAQPPALPPPPAPPPSDSSPSGECSTGEEKGAKACLALSTGGAFRSEIPIGCLDVRATSISNLLDETEAVPIDAIPLGIHVAMNDTAATTATATARLSAVSGRTPPLPDLRTADFFSTPVRGSVDAGQPDANGPLNPMLTLIVGRSREGGNRTADGQGRPCVNVTTNPLDISLIGARPTNDRSSDGSCRTSGSKSRGKAAGGNASGNKRSTQAATIVVQQPSLSLDGTAGAATILLHPELDVRRREENMRQLLDVANTLTLQEIHDFEMRYGSPHHSRSQSVKAPGSRSSGRPNYLCLPQQRSRVASMPNTGVEEEYYRLRHFSITGKGVVNRGDSLKSRRSRSNNSVASSNSSTEHLTASYPGSARNSAAGSLASSRESSASQGPTPYRVLMLGASAVGKSSLVSQFMTSEYLHAYDTSIDDESGEKTVSVLLAGEESELTFIDHSTAEMTPETCITTYEPHAYCVVYSTTDRASVRVAEEVLQTLWRSDYVSARAVILVGNKVDLVRSRLVSTEEGKSMATSYDCKFIETSVGINHNVDELLVGLLTQIRLKLENPERTRDLFRKRSRKNRSKSPLGSCSENNSPKKYRGSRTSTSLKVRNLLGKVWARDSKSKSCENLHVL
ncbi:GTP-binding protein RAD [Habropoda laboriosa]|uniref:GTP-binding protein RAD n=1 Tax=Habropoda laboriosa TaxID=597456 RepID=A0A0L7RB28_9HYME|nr:GTP-binding protein RAD [Habropoda laboriosa]